MKHLGNDHGNLCNQAPSCSAQAVREGREQGAAHKGLPGGTCEVGLGKWVMCLQADRRGGLAAGGGESVKVGRVWSECDMERWAV